MQISLSPAFTSQRAHVSQELPAPLNRVQILFVNYTPLKLGKDSKFQKTKIAEVK